MTPLSSILNVLLASGAALLVCDRVVGGKSEFYMAMTLCHRHVKPALPSYQSIADELDGSSSKKYIQGTREKLRILNSLSGILISLQLDHSGFLISI